MVYNIVIIFLELQVLFKPWDPIGKTTECTLTNTTVCKPDDGQVRPKHVA